MQQASSSRRLFIFVGIGVVFLLSVTLVGVSLISVTSVDALPTLSPQRRLLAAYQNQQRPLQALYHLESLADEHGWTPQLHRQVGDTWAQLGDMEQALYHWSQSATDDPLLLRSLAEVYLQQAEWTQAVDTLSQLIEQQPDNTWANYHLGMILAPYDWERAESHLQQAALDPIYHEAARALRVTLLENREDEVANGVGLPILVGLVLVEHEVWPYAEVAFNHANTLYLAANNEPLPEALAYLSLTRDEQGKDGQAVILRAVELAPNDPQIRFLEALHYRHVGAYEASLSAIIQAVALSPENPVLYSELGTAYRLTGDLEQAEYWLRAAVGFSNNDPQFQALLAQFYAEEAYNLGSDGLVALNSALQNNPDDPDLLAGMGWAFYSLGDYDEGREYIDQALIIAPNNERALYYKARVLLGTGEDTNLAFTLLTELAEGNSPYQSDAQRILETLQ